MTPSDQTELRQLKAIFEPLEASGFPTESVMKAISSAIATAELRARKDELLEIGLLAHKFEGNDYHCREIADAIDGRLAELEQSLRKEQE